MMNLLFVACNLCIAVFNGIFPAVKDRYLNFLFYFTLKRAIEKKMYLFPVVKMIIRQASS